MPSSTYMENFQPQPFFFQPQITPRLGGQNSNSGLNCPYSKQNENAR